MTVRAFLSLAPSRALALAALLAVAWPGSARAYRTSQDSLFNQRNGITGPVAFEPLPVRYTLFRGPSALALADVERATREAFLTWTRPSCSALEIEGGGFAGTAAIYGDDRNVVEWVEDGTWRARGFSGFTIGVTTNQLLRVGDRWTFDESDMELNADDFRWVIDGGTGEADPVDVQGLVVHEAGHFVGLLHTCEPSAQDGAPACASGGEPETMWPRYTGENQRTLEPDDVAGICFLYPAPGCATEGCPPGQRCVMDACVPEDAGLPSRDAGTPTDAGARVVDGGVQRDAGPAPEERGGCGCRVGRRAAHPGWLALLALLLLRRRRL